MKIKLDENLPTSLAGHLRALGNDVDTTMEEGLADSTDREVWAASQNAGRFFITQDLDFSDLRAFRAGNHKGILLVRLQPRIGKPSSNGYLPCFRRNKWRNGVDVSWSPQNGSSESYVLFRKTQSSRYFFPRG